MLLTGAPPYPFVAAGVNFADDPAHTPTMFWAEGTVLESDLLAGTFQRFSASGVSAPRSLPWQAFLRPSDDGMQLVGVPGERSYDSQAGTQFIAQQGFAAGSWMGRGADGLVRDFAVFSEPYGVAGAGSITPRVYLKLDYILTTVVTLSAAGLETGSLLIEPDAYAPNLLTTATFTYILPSGTHREDGVPMVSEGPTTLIFGNGVRVYSTFTRSTNFTVIDTDASEGIVGFGLGLARFRNGADSIQSDMLAGLYRGTVWTTGAESAAFFGGPVSSGLKTEGVRPIVLDVRADGTFSLYDQGAYDSGQQVPVTTGTWAYRPNEKDPALDRGRLELTDNIGRFAELRPARNSAGLLLPTRVRTESGTAELVFGELGAARYKAFSPGLNFQEAVFDVGQTGHVTAYEHATSSDADRVGWYSIDLVASVGGSPVEGEVYSWHDLTFDRVAVAGRSATTGHLQLWQRADERWTYLDLTATLDGAVGFGGPISGATYGAAGSDPRRNPRAVIVGTDADGKFIGYVESAGGWTFVPIESLGLLGEGVHPDLSGPLAGFGTPWNAYHFAGVDSSGQIWCLWWSPALDPQRWAVHNLSRIAGDVPPMLSHLTAVVTTWNAFHITGLDGLGRVVVTWWEQSVGWRYDGLTELTDGPRLVGVELSTNFNVSQEVLNIVGIDTRGSVVVYWWNRRTGWSVGYPASGLVYARRPAGPILSDGFLVPYTSVPGLIDSFQSITWRAHDNGVMRLSWHADTPAAWALDDLTQIATPR